MTEGWGKGFRWRGGFKASVRWHWVDLNDEEAATWPSVTGHCRWSTQQRQRL